MTCDCNAWISLLGLQTFQIAAVALVALLVARSVGKNRPHLAHAMWAVVILKCLTPPIVALPTSSFCWLSWDSNDNRATETNLHQAVLPSVIVDLADQTTSVHCCCQQLS